ncbi:MAG: lactate dehydrogenase [Methanoregula sp.]|nr:lactate dehydrogenase [Methanoregula sp.]
MARLAVMGVGRIGGEVAYLAATRGLARELVLCESAADLLRAQVLDLSHTGLDLAISTRKEEMKDADICIFSAGLPRNPSVKSRADLLHANLGPAREFVGLMKGFSGILITITNPMDAINFYLCDRMGIGRERCIGFGGQLDSARFEIALQARIFAGAADQSHGPHLTPAPRKPAPSGPAVLGEHGEHQVPVFSRLSEKIPHPERDEILLRLRGASMEVIRGKGGTVFGPAHHIAELVRMVLADSREEAICSSVLEGEYGLSGCSLGVPVQVDRNGIRKIDEWKLDAWEGAKMEEAGEFAGGLCREAVGSG